jgi:RIO-like serine/threonine protein kinase
MKKLTRKIPEITPIMILRLKEKFLTYGIIPNDLKRDNLALSNKHTITVIDYGNFVMKGD